MSRNKKINSNVCQKKKKIFKQLASEKSIRNTRQKPLNGKLKVKREWKKGDQTFECLTKKKNRPDQALNLQHMVTSGLRAILFA